MRFGAGPRTAGRGLRTNHPTTRPLMTTPAVHWQEGMFLQPHHFQAATRHTADLVRFNARWDHFHNWGLRRLEYDKDALAGHQFVVRALEARLRDGTLVSLPDDAAVPRSEEH